MFLLFISSYDSFESVPSASGVLTPRRAFTDMMLWLVTKNLQIYWDQLSQHPHCLNILMSVATQALEDPLSLFS